MDCRYGSVVLGVVTGVPIIGERDGSPAGIMPEELDSILVLTLGAAAGVLLLGTDTT